MSAIQDKGLKQFFQLFFRGIKNEYTKIPQRKRPDIEGLGRTLMKLLCSRSQASIIDDSILTVNDEVKHSILKGGFVPEPFFDDNGLLTDEAIDILNKIFESSRDRFNIDLLKSLVESTIERTLTICNPDDYIFAKPMCALFFDTVREEKYSLPFPINELRNPAIELNDNLVIEFSNSHDVESINCRKVPYGSLDIKNIWETEKSYWDNLYSCLRSVILDPQSGFNFGLFLQNLIKIQINANKANK